MSSSVRIPFAKPLITPDDKAAVMAVLDQDRLTDGPQGRQFELEFEEYTGGRHAVATSS